MKIIIITIDKNNNPSPKIELLVMASENAVFLAEDIPVQLELVGLRFVYVHYNPNLGNMTFSLRRRALLGHDSFYGSIVDFDAYVPLKRLPAAFLFRASEDCSIKVAIEA